MYKTNVFRLRHRIMNHRMINWTSFPKDENEINKIISDISDYCEAYLDPDLACYNYLKDLNTKFLLGFYESEIFNIVAIINNTCLYRFNLHFKNKIVLFGEFIYYAVFGGKLPGNVRNKTEKIIDYLYSFEDYLIENPNHLNDNISKIVDPNKFI